MLCVLNSKKGEFNLLLAVVVGSLVMVTVIVLFFIIGEGAEESVQNSRCRASLLAYAKVKNLPLGDARADEIDIDCPTQYVTIADASPSKTRKQVADLMAGCWNSFGEGKIRLFRAEDEKFCVVCSVFEFEDTSTRLDGMSSFLMAERAPYKVDGRYPTYQEYIAGVVTDPDVVDEARRSADLNYLDGGKRYAVMFTFYKQSYWSKIKGALVGGTIALVGSVVGVVVGVVTFGIGAPVSAMIIAGSVGAGAAIGAAAAGGGVTTEGADWDANIVLSEYSSQQLETFGCTALPVSQVDDLFK